LAEASSNEFAKVDLKSNWWLTGVFYPVAFAAGFIDSEAGQGFR
jgi:hypothetical protein